MAIVCYPGLFCEPPSPESVRRAIEQWRNGTHPAQREKAGAMIALALASYGSRLASGAVPAASRTCSMSASVKPSRVARRSQ